MIELIKLKFVNYWQDLILLWIHLKLGYKDWKIEQLEIKIQSMAANDD